MRISSITKNAGKACNNRLYRHIRTFEKIVKNYFVIYFKNKTNVNLRDYLLTEKMEYARRVLMNPSASISDVAYDVGYGDYRSFSRAFKNVHGITPSDFQAKYRS